MKEALGQEVKEKNNSEEGSERHIMCCFVLLCAVQCGIV